jgi:glycosyltransferase involved in cell wall biosynthesis
MRVLHVDPERDWRGGERQALWLARELARRGHHSVLAGRPGSRLMEECLLAGVPFEPVRPLAPVAPISALRLRSLLRHGEFQLVHAHTANALALAALATLGTGVALVASRRVDFHLNRGWATRWKYGRCRRVIAVSGAIRDVLLADGIEPGRIAVVPDGVDLSREIRPSGAATLGALGVTGGRPLVVMVAALVGHKAPGDFVAAVAAARDSGAVFDALLVGDGFLMPDVRRQAESLALEGVLHIAGWRDDADSLIAAADIVVLSSREEGMGSVLLDAMHCGRAIAATSAGGIPELVVDGENGLLTRPGDTGALGGSIARLLADASLRRRLGDAGRARAERFAMPRIAAATESVYQSALA